MDQPSEGAVGLVHHWGRPAIGIGLMRKQSFPDSIPKAGLAQRRSWFLKEPDCLPCSTITRPCPFEATQNSPVSKVPFSEEQYGWRSSGSQ